MLDFFSDSTASEVAATALRFSDTGLFLSFAFIAHYLYTLVTRCWRQSILIDYWHYVVGVGIVLPFFVMYPFASAAPNVLSVGTAMDDIRSGFGQACSINMVGYLALVFGGWMHRRAQASARRGRSQDVLYERVARRMCNAIQHGSVTLRLLELSCLLGVLVLLFAKLKFGAVFGIRDQLFQDPLTRVIFNIWYSVYVVSFALACIRLAHKPSGYVAVLLILAFVCSALTGSRSMTLLTAIDVLIACFAVYKGRVNLRAVVAAALLLSAVIGITTTLRNAEQQEQADSADNELPLVTLLYGNTLSDLRDFAWVLQASDARGELLLGRSYVSAMISFVPRGLSDFREKYSIGTYTNELIGIDSAVHPGVRGGKFLEPYLNFGLPGVLLFGYVAGNLLSRTCAFMAAQPGNASGLARAYGAIVPYFIFSQLLISSGFWVVYVFLFVLLAAPMPRKRASAIAHAAP